MLAKMIVKQGYWVVTALILSLFGLKYTVGAYLGHPYSLEFGIVLMAVVNAHLGIAMVLTKMDALKEKLECISRDDSQNRKDS